MRNEHGMRSARARRRDITVRVLRMFLAFVLAFGTTFWVQARHASDAFAEPGAVSQGLTAQDEQNGDGDKDNAGEAGNQDGDENQGGSTGDDTGGGTAGDDAGGGGGEGSGDGYDDTGGDGDGGEGGDGGEEEPSLYVADIGVFKQGTTRNAYAYASEGPSSTDDVRAVIDRKGGNIDFDAAILWNDGSDWEYDSGKVSWRIDDASTEIARISPSGILEAKGVDDGVVLVSAYVDGAYTEDGNELAAEFKVELQGQTDTKYVTKITICDDAGRALTSAYRFEAGTLSTAMLELQARVRVHDPASDDDEEYLVTPASGLASQTDGELADLIWESADTRLGTVSEEGIYRPAVAATNIVYCASTAGFNGSRVQAQATIDMPPANGKEAANGYHPQTTLTVKVYYEKYPDQLVGETEFSIADLQALGTVTQTYTALKGKEGYMTTTGRGPLLSKVLKAAGVNTDGIARLRFGTPDNYQGVVSWSMLVDTNRYYFPNIDIGQYTEKVQVAPMIAIDSYRNVGSDVSVHTDGLNDTRRFLLLFGAKDTGETTTNLQVYNIHTLYVELEGSPPTKNGTQVTVKFVDSITGKVLKSETTANPDSVDAPKAPDHDGYTFKGWNKSTDKAGNITYTAVYESDNADENSKQADDSGSQSNNNGNGGGSTPANNGNGANAGAGTHDLVSKTQQGSSASGSAGGPQQAQQMETTSETSVTQLDPNDVKTITQGRWSALQAINKHPSNVDDLMLDNPFAPYAAPFFAGAFAAGGLEAGIAFFRQRRFPKGMKLPV